MVDVPVNAPVPKLHDSVDVETLLDSVELVLVANPRTVAFAPPVAVMLPLSVAVDAVTLLGALVVRVGGLKSVHVIWTSPRAPAPP